jgi:hypothetical protein
MPEEWVVWNEYHGTVQQAVIIDVRPWKHGATGLLDGLEHDDVGRISVGELIVNGYVTAFGYYIMSPDYWRSNERRLRQQFARHVFTEGPRSKLSPQLLLGFSPDEDLTTEDVNEAYRLAALNAHPDKGGDSTIFVAVKNARDQLLEKIAHANSLANDDIPF